MSGILKILFVSFVFFLSQTHVVSAEEIESNGWKSAGSAVVVKVDTIVPPELLNEFNCSGSDCDRFFSRMNLKKRVTFNNMISVDCKDCNVEVGMNFSIFTNSNGRVKFIQKPAEFEVEMNSK